jgi:peroxin-7
MRAWKSHKPRCRNPQHANVFLSASGDNSAMIWDTRNAAPSLILKAHAKETLCGDWCKYNDCVLATCSIDKSIKVRKGCIVHMVAA